MKRFRPLYDRGDGVTDRSVDFVCFSGGGVKGVAFVGAVRALEEWQLTTRVCFWVGTSAGAIVAACVALGMRSDDMERILRAASFPRFFDVGGKSVSSSWWSKIQGFKDGFTELISRWGMARGDEFERWFEGIVESLGWHRDVTLMDLFRATGKHLVTTTTDVGEASTVVMSRSSHPTMRVVDAVKSSMLYPFVFQPRVDRTAGVSKLFIDGGLLVNFPIQLCDVIADDRVVGVNRRAIGFMLDRDEPTTAKMANVLEYAVACVRAMHSQLQLLESRQPYFDARVATIPTFGVASTDFDVDDETVTTLINGGYAHATSYLQGRMALPSFPATLFIPTSDVPVRDHQVADTRLFS